MVRQPRVRKSRIDSSSSCAIDSASAYLEWDAAHHAHARPAHRGEVLDVADQAEDLARVEVEELARRVDARHQRHVARLVAALGQVHRERRLRGARDARQHDVGAVQRVQVRAVVVAHRELDRLDALEVLVREAVQQARLHARLGVQVLRDVRDQRAEQVDAGHPDRRRRDRAAPAAASRFTTVNTTSAPARDAASTRWRACAALRTSGKVRMRHFAWNWSIAARTVSAAVSPVPSETTKTSAKPSESGAGRRSAAIAAPAAAESSRACRSSRRA